METKWPWTWRLTVIKTINEADQTTDDQCQDDCQRWLCCFCMQPPLSIYKSSWPLIVKEGGVRLWTGVHIPAPQLLASKIKQTSLSTNLASLLAFERWAARPHFHLQEDRGVTDSCWLRKHRQQWLPIFRSPPRAPGNHLSSLCW